MSFVALVFYPQCISMDVLSVIMQLFGVCSVMSFFCNWLQYSSFKLELPDKWLPGPESSGSFELLR